nr:acyltransferase domain-containing protein [Acidimicrobiales bacterium]
MTDSSGNAVAIVAMAAIMPDAPDAEAFWSNITGGRYSISPVDPQRWDPALYFDPDPKAPDKTYSQIGGWVRDFEWDPFGWHLPVPPKVAEAMDPSQRWAVSATRRLLADYGAPERPLDRERTAVILGNAMAGEKHYLTALRATFPELARELDRAPDFAALPADVQAAIRGQYHANLDGLLPEITEDTMPGELGNCMAGRIANLFDLHGPNFVVDAACASAMAAIDSSLEGLVTGEFDAVITGGIDRNMGASTFVKFCKIGALSATGTRPFDAGADGFVMGEGMALLLLKRLADAERDGDRIYAVLRGVGGASDGRGKGITAPNPVGQKLAVERAWRNAGLSPADCTLIEAHGTSTRVGDVVEVGSVTEVFSEAGVAPGSVALGSVKSNIGHLKGAAGAAGLFKTAMALYHKVLPPSLNFAEPNPNVDWSTSPLRVNTELRDWEVPAGKVRTAGVSAFGFGGTNFHCVLEEHVPGRLRGNGSRLVAVGADLPSTTSAGAVPGAGSSGAEPKVPLRGALVLGAADEAGLVEQLRAVQAEAEAGRAPAPQAPSERALRSAERVVIDYGDAAELADRAARALKAVDSGVPAAWRALRGRGVFRGSGEAPQVAFLYTGQGSQYANMLADLRQVEPVVAEVFAEADDVMTPLLEGRPLSEFIFVDGDDPDAVTRAEEDLRQTEITQPAVLATDLALTKLLAAYGVVPDLVMGHSLGEYGALVAAGSLTFPSALEAVSARGSEMAHIAVEDNGAMAAVFAPLDEVRQLVAEIDGYVVVANVNCLSQSVIGGSTEAVMRAIEAGQARGWQVVQIPVSHAFHTEIVAPASEPLRAALQRLELRSPELPIVSNVTGRFYPMGPDTLDDMLDLLCRQVASPVQFVDGLRTLYDAGARVFVEVGPKRALQGFASDVLGDEDVLNLFTNHPKQGAVVAFNQALCGLYAAGLGVGRAEQPPAPAAVPAPVAVPSATPVATAPSPGASAATPPASEAAFLELGHLFADVLDQGRRILEGRGGSAPAPGAGFASGPGGGLHEPVVVSGAALGLPGTERIFDDPNLARLLHGEQLIDVIPTKLRHELLDKHITRLVKSEEGMPRLEEIDSPDEVIKLAARGGQMDLEADYGVDSDRLAALDRVTQLAIAAGLDALRDAGIPLVMRYKTTTKGTKLPEGWALPDALRDDTGIVFASAFPGYDAFAEDLGRFWTDHARREHLSDLEGLRERLVAGGVTGTALEEVDRRIHDLRLEIEEHEYRFDRRFLFRILSMGHSQFAELIGARGPNTQVNAACASTTQAVALAEDWIRAGRCRRVVILAADDVTSDQLLGWIGAGFLASGAAATDDVVEEAALPFDQRRHGMIMGMGAAAIVVESADAARQRGVQPICEVLGTVTANSAYHGTRLDVEHIGMVMEDVVRQAEWRGRVSRAVMAPQTVFVSHETYTPARGGSASAEIHALRQVFGADADRVVIANTKGFTGHPMGVGIEDVVAVKSLETGLVPPVANFKEIDPELGALNLSRGGVYPVEYALRLAAGFGSQISMLLLRRTPVADGRHRNPEELGYAYRVVDPVAWTAWLRAITGYDEPSLEVVQRRLRVADQGPATAPSVLPAAAPSVAPTVRPAPAPAPVAPAPAAPAAPAPVPAAPAAPAPAAPAVVVPVTARDVVAERVLGIVADQTGYPPDLLDPELDLEADLGVDTVKQAEVFASIREAYGIARDDSL